MENNNNQSIEKYINQNVEKYKKVENVKTKLDSDGVKYTIVGTGDKIIKQ